MVLPLSVTAVISVAVGLFPEFFLNFARSLLP
jgi:hypothetical protein